MTEHGKDLPQGCRTLIERDERERAALRERVDHLAFQLDEMLEILDEATERMFLPLEDPIPVAASAHKRR